MTYQRFLSAVFALLMLFSSLGCGGTQANRTSAPDLSLGDAVALTSPDVSLLGLPETDAGVDGQDARYQVSDAPALVPNNQNGELIVALRQDAAAPFNGVLFKIGRAHV